MTEEVFPEDMSVTVLITDKSEDSIFLKAAAFRKNTWRTELHKHNRYFELVYLSAGLGYHTIDNRQYEVRVPELFFIRQEQVHHWDLDEQMEPDGFVLILKRIFFERSLDGELKELLEKVSQLSCAYLAEAGAIDQILGLIVQENARENGGSFSFVGPLLK